MNLVIVNSGVGNVRSVANMLKRFKIIATVSDRPEVVAAADALILPGVGAYDAAMRRLRENDLKSVLDTKAIEGKTPILGICLGMQLMGDRSDEGMEPGFGWIPGELHLLQPKEGEAQEIRVPHMGWNLVVSGGDDLLYRGIEGTPRFYFDHSYHFVPRNPAHISSVSYYGFNLVASIRKGPLFGVQFHPEKSHRFGLKLLENFVSFADEWMRVQG